MKGFRWNTQDNINTRYAYESDSDYITPASHHGEDTVLLFLLPIVALRCMSPPTVLECVADHGLH